MSGEIVMEGGPPLHNTSHGTFNGSIYADTNHTSAESVMPSYAQAVLILMYATITVLAVGGNAIVVYIVLAYQRMRTVTNYFIVNLSLGDIIMAVLCIPFTFIANLLMQFWPFGSIMCPIVSYAQAVAVFISAFTMVAISLDRYVAILWPMRPRMTSRQALLVIALIWLLSLMVPLPIAIVSKITVRVTNHMTRTFQVSHGLQYEKGGLNSYVKLLQDSTWMMTWTIHKQRSTWGCIKWRYILIICCYCNIAGDKSCVKPTYASGLLHWENAVIAISLAINCVHSQLMLVACCIRYILYLSLSKA